MTNIQKPLSEEEVKSKTKSLNKDWQIFNNKEMSRVFNFDGFKEAIDFVNKIADIAIEMDHHPAISIDYDKVIIELSTHKVGGLTEKDFDLAGKIEEII